MIEKLAQFTDIRCCLIVGGLSTKVFLLALSSIKFLMFSYGFSPIAFDILVQNTTFYVS
jgi:hypothetical protein